LVQGKQPIASFSFPIQKRAPRGVPKISLTVRVSASGAMSVTLSEPGTTNVLDRDGMLVRVVS
jgi:molecular chaperone DnaK (HSP70)